MKKADMAYINIKMALFMLGIGYMVKDMDKGH